MLLKIIPFVFIIPSLLIIFAARTIVIRKGMDHKIVCDFEHEMEEADLKQYKINKAVINVKMLGMLLALPGFILVLIVYK